MRTTRCELGRLDPSVRERALDAAGRRYALPSGLADHVRKRHVCVGVLSIRQRRYALRLGEDRPGEAEGDVPMDDPSPGWAAFAARRA